MSFEDWIESYKRYWKEFVGVVPSEIETEWASDLKRQWQRSRPPDKVVLEDMEESLKL